MRNFPGTYESQSYWAQIDLKGSDIGANISGQKLSLRPTGVLTFDANGRVGIDYGVYGVPETYVIDKRGVIRYKRIGALTPEIVKDKVLPLMQELGRG